MIKHFVKCKGAAGTPSHPLQKQKTLSSAPVLTASIRSKFSFSSPSSFKPQQTQYQFQKISTFSPSSSLSSPSNTSRAFSKNFTASFGGRGASAASQAEERDSKNSKKKIDVNVLKRLLEQAKKEKRLLVFAFICLIFSSISSLVTPWIIGKLIDSVDMPKEEAAKQLQDVGKTLAVIFLVGGAATFGRTALVLKAGQSIAANLRKQLYKSVLSQETAFFDKNRSGELVNRLNVDVQVVSETMSETLVSGTRSLAEAIGGVALLCYLSLKLTGVALGIFPALGIGAVFYGRMVRKLSKQYMDSLAASNSLATEKLSNMRTVRLFTNEKYELAQYSNKINDVYDLGKKVGYMRGSFYATVSTLANFSMLAVLWIGAQDVLAGNITIGGLSSFLMYSIYIGMSFTNLSSIYGDINKTMGASERIFELMDRKPLIPTPFDPHHTANLRLPTVQGLIELDNVFFSYQSAQQQLQQAIEKPDSEQIEEQAPEFTPVLKGLTLTLQPNTVTALVGFSGSGKSTILSLISRLYDIQEGTIKLDGVDIRDLDVEWLRKQIAVVSQDPVLFVGTIEENIRYAIGDEEERKKITREDIIEAAKKAHAHEFISKFEKGYDTLVGEHSVTLSGGQKQRIAIARAILKNARILIMDEATSALDAESEHYIQQSLFESGSITKNRTTLIIAHRLSTIKRADNVAVLHEGKVAEIGTHDELLQRNGIYKQLVTRQLTSMNH